MNKRVFLAVNLPAKTRKRIATGLLPLIPRQGVKPVREENLHITISFLGYIPENAVEELVNSLEKAGELSQFKIELSGVGHFKNRVLWLGVKEGREKLFELNRRISSALGVEDKKFHPHVTLARNKFLKRKEFNSVLSALQEMKFSETVEAESLDVMESVLSSTGPTYSVLEKIEFEKR